MAASLVVSPLAAPVKLVNGFATGTALRPCGARNGVSPAAPGGLQVVAMKKLLGKVITTSNDKSVTVEVRRIAVHSKYKKRVRTSKNYIVHDPENKCKTGDIVTLTKIAPVSKRKSFAVLDVRAGLEAELELSQALEIPLQSAARLYVRSGIWFSVKERSL
ncbi:hypothetical protein R1sor_009679 [Riccia sorocarpa]|uniref:30S ribosomal protein S17, chloroplastic n=1 Tax=Riccia sorocarpa TaxID=122646 RepID=A0ABD3HW24_9MARC